MSSNAQARLRYHWIKCTEDAGAWHLYDVFSVWDHRPGDPCTITAICGQVWDDYTAAFQPPLKDPHCLPCMRELHRRTLAGE